MTEYRLIRENPDHGHHLECVKFFEELGDTHITVSMFDGSEDKMCLENARSLWTEMVGNGWERALFDPDFESWTEKSEVAPQPKERLRRKKQRVKAAMTGFDKLSKASKQKQYKQYTKKMKHELSKPNYALEA